MLLDLASETYFGLNEVGTRIWILLAEGTPLVSVHAALCEEFDAPADAIERDLLVLAVRLCDAGLVTIARGTRCAAGPNCRQVTECACY